MLPVGAIERTKLFLMPFLLISSTTLSQSIVQTSLR